MRQGVAAGVAEVPSELLELPTSTGSGSVGSGSSSTTTTNSRHDTTARDTTSESSDDTSLDVWLSISVPVVLLLVSFVVLFCYFRRKKTNPNDTRTDAAETGTPSLPTYHLGRRRGGGPHKSRMATLTMQDEEALASWRIDPENIEPLHPLGAGVYGTVWLATYLGETVIVKKLSPPMPAPTPRTKSWRKTSRPPDSGTSAHAGPNARTRTKSRGRSGKSALRQFLAEIRVLTTLSHPKIVAFYGVAWTSLSKLESNHETAGIASDVQMVLEFMSRGDLREYLARTRSDVRARAWGAQKLSMALDIAEALAYLHSRQPKPILHRDLTSSKIFLDSTYTAKVADFRVSRYGIPHLMEGEEDDGDDSDDQLAMPRFIGNNRWIAPEVLSGDARYSTAVDMYSFGVILSELDSHEMPFSDVKLSNGQPLPESAVIKLLRTGAIRPSLSDRCPRGVAMLVMECLTLEPRLRPTAVQAVERLRALLERERRVSDIGDDVNTSGQNSFLGAKEDHESAYSSNSSIDSSIISIERGFTYAVLKER